MAVKLNLVVYGCGFTLASLYALLGVRRDFLPVVTNFALNMISQIAFDLDHFDLGLL